MTPTKALSTVAGFLLLTSISGCFWGGDGEIVLTCDEPQAYQSVVGGKRIEVPEGLDPLDDFKEMPIPKSETTPRPEGSRCIETPPSILSGTPDSG